MRRSVHAAATILCLAGPGILPASADWPAADTDARPHSFLKRWFTPARVPVPVPENDPWVTRMRQRSEVGVPPEAPPRVSVPEGTPPRETSGVGRPSGEFPELPPPPESPRARPADAPLSPPVADAARPPSPPVAAEPIDLPRPAPGPPTGPTPPPTGPATPDGPLSALPEVDPGPAPPSAVGPGAPELLPPPGVPNLDGALPDFGEAPLPSSDTLAMGLKTRTVCHGDQSPFFALRMLATEVPRPPVPPVPPVPPAPRPGNLNAAIFVPWARGFKIGENQSPRPQDRIFFSFNYYNNLNADVNRRLGGTFRNVEIYRQLYGVEKTFFGGDASLGLRVPVNTLTADSPVRGLTPTRTSFGNLTAFGKLIVWKDEPADNLISAGLAVSAPNGPSSFAGAPYAVSLNSTQIQPFIGYFFSNDRWYLQGFESVDVPTDDRDVTMLYNDVVLGYVAYESEDRSAWLSGLAPSFEVHANVPLNHRGVLRADDPFTTPVVVDLTYGLTAFIRERSVLSVGCVQPVTGPKPFSFEVLVLFNYYFGKPRPSRLQTLPGSFGG